MVDWSKCSAVESVPGKVSGNWVFTSTRLPVYALFENLAEGATIHDFIEWFGGVDESEVKAVLEHVAQEPPGKGRPCASCLVAGLPGSCASGFSAMSLKRPGSPFVHGRQPVKGRSCTTGAWQGSRPRSGRC